MKYLFNPFIRIAGLRSLLLGWTAMLLTAAIAYFSHCHFDGVLDAHVGPGGEPAWVYLLEPALSWSCAVIVFYIAAVAVAPSGVRFIDIAGTMALSRWPMLFVALLCFIPAPLPEEPSKIRPSLIFLGLAMLVFAIWMIALMYNAYSVSSGAKGTKRLVSFIIALVVAEALSKVLYYLLF